MADQIPVFDVKPVRQLDIWAQTCLAGFYAIEMADALGPAKDRYLLLLRMQIMLESGHARMYMATIEGDKPIGFIVTVKTDKREIRRLEAVWVGQPYRRQGVARRLLAEARRGGADFHSYAATPAAVAWHLANGFRAIGVHAEGTEEMFTGNYVPEYNYEHAQPVLMPSDLVEVNRWDELDRQRRSQNLSET